MDNDVKNIIGEYDKWVASGKRSVDSLPLEQAAWKIATSQSPAHPVKITARNICMALTAKPQWTGHEDVDKNIEVLRTLMKKEQHVA